MRPILLAILLGPLFRTPTLTALAHARKIPALEYPLCPRRRDFGYFPSRLQQSSPILMADMSASSREEVERLAEPCENEGEILKDNNAQEDALNTGKDMEKSTAPEEEKLPKLTAAEFKAYNGMAEHMNHFHNYFRQSWNLLYQSCATGKRPASLSLKQFINTGLQFCNHLSTHHAIEERHVFPMLATKMPEFKQGRNAAELLRQHKEIHAGLDLFEEYLRQCKSGETELDLRTLKVKMDSWGTVLWTHLDQEVRTLGAENMRKYWTLEEMRRMPM